MRRRGRPLTLLLLVVGLVLAAMPAQTHHEIDPHTRNLRPLGDTDDNRPISTFLESFFTDAAFWDDLAFQGTWNGGFRMIHISSPARPRMRSEVDGGTFQGDIGVWGKLVFRSVDTPVAATTPAETCDAPAAESGFEGASRSSGLLIPPTPAPTTWSRRSGPTVAPTPKRWSPTPGTTGC
jgi:hypothetical protein